MTSFFEKLKKGMGVEEPVTEEDKVPEGEQAPYGAGKKPKKIKKSREKTNPPPDELELKTELLFMGAKVKKRVEPSSPIRRLEIQTETSEDKIKEGAPKEPAEQKEKKWPSFGEDEEGQLAIDVCQTEKDLVIQSAIAGVKPESLDISIERDIISIKGNREKPLEEKGDYFVQECFWGPFSREIIAPVEVDPGRATAEMKNGILTIRIPKILREKKKKIIIRG